MSPRKKPVLTRQRKFTLPYKNADYNVAYLRGVHHAHDVAMASMPFPCGKKAAAVGRIMSVPILAIERMINDMDAMLLEEKKP